MKKTLLILSFYLVFLGISSAQIKALIVDGQNNHVVWPKSTIMMEQYLEETGLFTVDVYRSKYTWNAEREKDYLPLAGVGETEDLKDPTPDPDFAPKFSDYDVVISNFGWKAAPWPEKTQKAFEKFMKKGGGFVTVHAADNSFPEWVEYNKMIGLGGWGNRTEKDGPYVYYTNEGELKTDNTAGNGGSHGPQNNIQAILRVADHPITNGLPSTWFTAKDECYAKLRGPAENMTILATGKDMSGKAPTDRHEPMLMVIDYYKGRVFHTTIGHEDYSIEGVDFITTFLRGTEWAATGKVTIPIPADFPKQGKQSSRPFVLKE
ncbi:MAG: ThuA domain-containing protein [Bacteroidota bacterium]